MEQDEAPHSVSYS